MKKEKKQRVFTVITVLYNAEDFIEETIKSVLNQTNNNIEYILIDGGSTDNTLPIVKKYMDHIDYFISEKDKGIYDAMNKGISVSTGKYINFLNAGDTFANKYTLEHILNEIKKVDYEPDIIYGSVSIYSENKSYITTLKPLYLSKLFLNMFNTRVVCHQSVFIKKEKCSKYSLNYKIKGDLNWYYDLLENVERKKIYKSQEVVSNYLLGGLSNNNLTKSYMETIGILFKKNNIVMFLYSLPFLFIPIFFKMKNILFKGDN